MSLDRQRLDNLAALSAGRPIPQYGPPTASDRKIQQMYDQLTWWDKLMSVGTYIARIKDAFSSSPNQNDEKTNIKRLELYPSPKYLDKTQVNLLHSYNQLRSFNHRTFEQAIHFFDLFAYSIQSIQSEKHIDLKTSHFINAIQYSRKTIELLWSIQFSIDGQLEAAHNFVIRLVAETKINHRTHLINSVNYLNQARAQSGYPPIDLLDHSLITPDVD